MKSIFSKLVLLIIICTLASTLFIGGLAIWRFQSVMTQTAADTLNLTCSENQKKLNINIDRIEKAVNILAVYTEENLESIEKLSDTEYLDTYTKSLQSSAIQLQRIPREHSVYSCGLIPTYQIPQQASIR